VTCALAQAVPDTYVTVGDSDVRLAGRSVVQDRTPFMCWPRPCRAGSAWPPP